MDMRITTAFGAGLVAALIGLATLDAEGPGAMQTAKTRIGVFDSRLVALAYYNSTAQRAALQRMQADLREAKAAADDAKVKELEFEGPALQNLMHYQVFSTASIPNVMMTLAPSLPKVAERAGVVVIVSKWEIAYQLNDVELVDVTDELVREFNPNAQVQKWIAEMAKKQPVPLLQLVKTAHTHR